MRGIIYAVVVSLISTFIFGTDTLHISAATTDGTQIPLNQHITGTLKDADQKDVYKVSLPNDGNLHVAITNDSIARWHMFVLNDQGNQLDDVTTDKSVSGDSEVQVGLPQGDYFIEVENSSNSVGVEYDLTTNFEESPFFEKENNNSLETANPISLNQSYKGTLSSSYDHDYYKVVVEQDGNLTLSIDEQTFVSWNGMVFNSKGEELDFISRDLSNSHSGKDGFTQIGISKGTYYIAIGFGYNSSHIPYTFTVGFTKSDYFEKEFNDSIATANPILVNKTYNGTIGAYYDEDYYKVTLPADGKITLSVKQIPGVSWYAYILNAKGEEFAENWTDAGQPAPDTLDQTIGLAKGTYYVKIRYNGSIDVPYSFIVKYTVSPYYEKEFNNTLSTANSIVLNQPYTGILQNDADKDYFKVTVNQTGYVGFMLKNQSIGTSWKGNILNARGSLIKSFTTGYSKGYTTMKIALPKGTYYIKMDNSLNAYTFPYELKVVQYSNPLAVTQTTIKNIKKKPDTISVSKIAKGDVIKVYNSKKQLIAAATSKGTSVTATVKQLGAVAGTVYVSVTHPGMLESNLTAKKFSKE